MGGRRGGVIGLIRDGGGGVTGGDGSGLGYGSHERLARKDCRESFQRVVSVSSVGSVSGAMEESIVGSNHRGVCADPRPSDINPAATT